MTFDLQDQGNTLKIFVTSTAEQEKLVRKQMLDELTKLSQAMGLYDDFTQEPKWDLIPNTVITCQNK